MKQIFPKEIIDSTIEVHRFKHKVKSKIIYTILLLGVIVMMALLPFIYLDIYSSARGIIKSKKERNKIISLFSGKVAYLNLRENQFVKQGDTLLIVDNSIGKEQLNLLKVQLKDNKQFVEDLEYLLKGENIYTRKLLTLKYKEKYIQYNQKLYDLKTRSAKAKRDFNRQDKLYEKEVIAKVDYENSKYIYDLTINDLNNYKKQQKNLWQSELTELENTIKSMESNYLQSKKQQENYTITASVSGTIQNLIGLERGSFIASGQIAEISPETDLIAECYVSPSDIGMLKINNKVKLQIDAFNYNQWGMATGIIIDINKDITIINNRPMFRVVCKVNESYLKLKNGFKGKFKKGMTFNARFFIIRRSAFDLLYDKIDDWFVPNGNVE